MGVQEWVLFKKAAAPPPSEITSGIWHMGWGAEDMKGEYQKQMASGTKFETPITDISDLAGRPPDSFFFAYVDGPDHELIELNTSSHHHFGHVHMLSEDPIAAGEWYQTHLGCRSGRNRRNAGSIAIDSGRPRILPAGRSREHHHLSDRLRARTVAGSVEGPQVV